MMLRAETKLIPFRGNGPYCYSNTASMLLYAIGEQVSPQEMETYTGVGLGAFWLPKEKLLFFSSISNPPDLGISRALHLLGFGFEENVTSDPGKPPFEQLRSDLASSAAVLGPLDMGYLTHNPLNKRMMGADHFVLAYRFEKDKVSPAERGFMVHFSFKLGGRRALDFAGFFGSKHPELARLKEKQAELFGVLQSFAVQRKWTHVAASLGQLAQVEAEFRDALISS